MHQKLSPRACSCTIPHDAALQLDLRNYEDALLTSDEHRNFKNHIRFRAFMSLAAADLGITWRGMAVELMEDVTDELEDTPGSKQDEVQEPMAKVGMCESSWKVQVKASSKRYIPLI